MATISTNSTGPYTASTATTNSTWSTYAGTEITFTSHDEFEKFKESHLAVVKDQEERIVALEELVTQLRDTLDQYKDILNHLYLKLENQ